MRRQLSWLIAVPLAVIGTLAGHSVGYRAAVPDAHERAHVLASSGHGYLDYAPLLLSLCVALAVLGFVASAPERLQRPRGHERGTAGSRSSLRSRRWRSCCRSCSSATCTTGMCTGACSSRRRSCSDWRRRFRSRCSRPRSRSHWPQRRTRVAAGTQSAFSTAGRAPTRGRVRLLALGRSAGRACSRTRLRRPRASASRLAEQERPSPAADRSEERWTITRSRRSCRPVLVAVAAVLAALALVPAAGAHARLITTEPANDAVLEQSPRSVLLRFDEPVETAFGAIRVYDARARRVDSGEVERPSEPGGADLARPAACPRHLHGDLAGGVGRRSSRLRRVRLPRRRSRREPGGRRGAGARGRHADVGVGAVLDRAGARLPPAPPGRRRHADARRRARPGSAEDTLAAVAPARRRRAAARARGARGDRAPGRGGGRLRPRRGAALGRRLGGAGNAVRRRSGSCRPGWRWPVRCCSWPAAASRC